MQGSETYKAAGSYAGTVEIGDEAGDGTSLSFTTDVATQYTPSDNLRGDLAAASGPTMVINPGPDSLATALLSTSLSQFRKKHGIPSGGQVTIQMTPGYYDISQPVVVTAADSNVTIQGTGAVLNGGTEIVWSTDPNVSGEYRASIGSLGVFRDLYIQSGTGASSSIQRAVRASYPEFGPTSQNPIPGTNPPEYVNVYGQINADETWYPNPVTSTNSTLPTAVEVPSSEYPGLQAEFQDEQHFENSNSVPTNPMEFVAVHGSDESRFLIDDVTSTPSGTDWMLSLANWPNAYDSPAQFTNNFPYYIDNYVYNYTSGGDPALQGGAPGGPGEWYEDQETGYIYYMPAAGAAAPTAAFVPGAAAGLGSLMEIGGATAPSAASPVKNFKVIGLTFNYAGWAVSQGIQEVTANGYIGTQTGVYNAAPVGTHSDNGGTQIGSTYSTEQPAVSVVDASGTVIKDCTFSHLGGAGLGLICQTSNSSIIGDNFSDISGNGILVDGVQSIQNLSALGTNYGRYTSIAQFASDNDSIIIGTVNDCGVEYPDAAGISAGFAENLTIRGVDLYNLPADGIADGRGHNSYNGEYTYWYDPGVNATTTQPPGSGTWCVCTIESNMIHEVGLVLADEGGIYLDGCNWDFQKKKGQGTFVEDNLIYNLALQGTAASVIEGAAATNNYPIGIYADSGANGLSVVGNHLSYVEGPNPIFFHDVSQFLGTRGSDPQFRWNEASQLSQLFGSHQHASATALLAYTNTYNGNPWPAPYV